jgi:F-type H+-transporting ATPase subunit gamma
LSDRARFVELRGAVELMLKSFENGECDTFEVLYSQFISPIKQIPTLETILPLTDVSSILNTFVKEYTAAAPIKDDARPFIIEPSIKEILAGLIPLYIKQEIYHTALEAKASEHSARMVAMKNATDNANQLAADLNLSYNKARQAAITNEILEIAAAQSAGGN